MKHYYALILTGILSFTLLSCCDEHNELPSENDGNHYINTEPTEDEVKTQFNGSVAFLQQNADAAISYLKKRFVNTTSSLTENSDVVVMDEASAANITNNNANYSLLKHLWNSNKIIIFINPNVNAYILQKKLEQLTNDTPIENPTANELSMFDGVNIYAIRTDGTALFHEKIGCENGIESSVTTDDMNNNSTNDALLTATPNNTKFIPNEYHKGRLAENVATWLNENAQLETQANVAFSRTDSEYTMVPTSITRHFSYTLTHDWVTKYCEDAEVPAPTVVDAKTRLDIYGAFYTTTSSDVYDVAIYEEFPANTTYVENAIIHEHLAYKYKYTGGCYYGPTVDLRLKDIDVSTIEIEQPTPLKSADGQYNSTHYPMQIGFGTSLQGSASLGLEGPSMGLSMGLSSSCTLPYTTISFNHAEMPFEFSNTDKHATWAYSTNYKAYTCNAGFNAKFNDIPDIVHSFCHTDQAVTFIVGKSKSFEKNTLSLLYDIKWTTYSEYGAPWDHIHHTHSKIYKNILVSLPKINRYFEKYTPTLIPKFSGPVDGSGWTNLQTILKNNINYRALCDETLQVGAQTEADLDATATTIWREAIQSLVTQHNGTQTSDTYVIALADSSGHHLPLGLVIRNGEWYITENVDSLTF